MIHLVLLTHQRIGESLLAVAKHTLGSLPVPVTVIGITEELSSEQIEALIKNALRFPSEDSLLILTDLMGSTPYNTIKSLAFSNPLQVITGVNMPMLLQVLSDLTQIHSLETMAEKAIDAGKNGIHRE